MRRRILAIEERGLTRDASRGKAEANIGEFLAEPREQCACRPNAWAGERERVLAKATNSLSALRLTRVEPRVNKERMNFGEIGNLADNWAPFRPSIRLEVTPLGGEASLRHYATALENGGTLSSGKPRRFHSS